MAVPRAWARSDDGAVLGAQEKDEDEMSDLQIDKIRNMPVVIDNNHQSLYRSHAILMIVCDLLEKGTPADVVLALIREYGQPFPQVTVTENKK